MMNLRKSSKKQAKIKLALQGCAGSGKTYSALLLAYGLCNWKSHATLTPLAKQDCPPLATI